jgi:hypothetical protein
MDKVRTLLRVKQPSSHTNSRLIISLIKALTAANGPNRTIEVDYLRDSELIEMNAR